MAAQSKNLGQQLTSFFSAMFNRMVGRAMANNGAGTGHISSTQLDVGYGGSPAIGGRNGSAPPGTGQPGNLGGGAIPIGNIAVYPDPNSIGFIKQGFLGNSTVYTIVARISRKFAYVPRYVYEVKDPQAVRTYKHFLREIDTRKAGFLGKIEDLFQKAYSPVFNASGGMLLLASLLERPNPRQGQDSFFETLSRYFLTLGECMIWCNRGTDAEDLPKIDGPILEMYALPPQYLEMVPDPLNVWGSLGWVFNVAGKRIPIDNENVIHILMPNPDFDGVTRTHMRGLSPLRPGAKKLTEDESAQDASVALNQNQGAKGIAYDQTPGVMSPNKETAIRGAIDRKVNNRDARGSVAYIQGQLGYIDLAQTSQDMELEARKDNIFDRMCNMWGISPDIFKTGQTYQNLVQARKDLMTDLIIPMACQFNDEFNRILPAAFGLNRMKFKIDIDITMIVELQDDMSELVDSLMNAWWLTPNERRKEMHQAPSPEEEADDMWIPNNLVRMEDAAQPADTVPGMQDIYDDPKPDDGNDADQEDEGAKKDDSKMGPDDEGNPPALKGGKKNGKPGSTNKS